MLFARRCPVCGRAGGAPCGACAGALRPAPALPPPPGVDACRALLAYEGTGRELVARLKYRNERGPLRTLAASMAALVAHTEVDVVTWAPTSPARRRARGFDQAELLARAVARRLRVPAASLLRRVPGAPQTILHGAARRAGPAFAARGPVRGRVLLVDDVVTTGATVRSAARALRAAGAERVVVLAAARTPLKAVAARSDTSRDG